MITAPIFSQSYSDCESSTLNFLEMEPMSSRSKRILAAALETNKNSQVLEEALTHSIIFTNEDVIIENMTNDGFSKGISEIDSVLPLTLSYNDMNVDIIDALVHNAEHVSPSKHADGSTVFPIAASGENNVSQLRYADIASQSVSKPANIK
ncbi:unnamed protein product [Acanthoscelides obtectus]|uniref:Uncharacterized protein n=1 Tax=Acanthoscelides obtectus TaxID=200917 RepID=A0A9P0VPH3_ACAOB|nr:unnamed protein product [Acanthoscelides obtectus]CAK1685885.1 hypothetical protein AOBTE_LOCUS35693 [Acanthoscelides obtectus]